MTFRIPQALRYTIGIGEIFTTAKSFEANPIIGSKILNRRGLQVGRLLLAQAATCWRRLFLAHLISKQKRRHFLAHGHLAIPVFWPKADFAKVRPEVANFSDDRRYMTQGETKTYQGQIDAEALEVSSRLALYAFNRPNPFNPFPGLFPSWRARIEERATRNALLKADADAARRGIWPTGGLANKSVLNDTQAA